MTKPFIIPCARNFSPIGGDFVKSGDNLRREKTQSLIPLNRSLSEMRESKLSNFFTKNRDRNKHSISQNLDPRHTFQNFDSALTIVVVITIERRLLRGRDTDSF